MAVDPARAKALFLAASELASPVERDAYLDRECGGEAELRAWVEALLAARDRTGPSTNPDPAGSSEATAPETPHGIRTSAPEAARTSQPEGGDAVSEGFIPSVSATGEHRPDGLQTTLEAAGEAVAGRVIAGRYTLREALGEGGMGTVYLADQIEPVRRQVALKLIKVGMDSRAVLARFDAERQALALMDHPNIARVFDGGTTAAGQPFFVMELVNGVPITEYCDRRRLPIRDRLALFVSVCQAVQHAHQKGIIHRDLKPSNILVTEVDGRPTPKVIDFGVAKATESPLTNQSLADSGAIVGTPTYMSPEQADPSSMDIDTRTDVYALGVVLYELLAGSPPIDARQFKRGAILEMLRIVREVDPPRPSTRVSTSDALPNIAASRDTGPEHLKRALRGDLDWIVMKALEKDRSRRYETAIGFAADVQRHLANEPVLAAPPSRAYRMRKFFRKHRAAVTAATVVLLALLAGIVGTSIGLREAKRQESLAVAAQSAESARAEAEARERQRAEKAEADALDQLDNSNFLLAVAAYDNHDVPGSRLRLDSIRARKRGWEWGYLRRQSEGGIFTLYSRGVSTLAFSPDGSRIATGGYDRTVRLWDAITGTPSLEMKGHTNPVTSVGYSPDGSRIVTGSQDRTARVWDARTGATLLELKGHAGRVLGVAFSPDGSRIATGSQDRTARVWDARTGATLLRLAGHTNQVSSVAFSPDGSRIATGSWDLTARVWHARTGLQLLELGGHTAVIWGVAFSPDGSRIATGSYESAARVWDAQTGSALLELKGHTSPVFNVAFSPDGSRIATASYDRTARVWDARTGATALVLKGHTDVVSVVAFSPDASHIATVSLDGTKFWDARTGTPQIDLKGHGNWVDSVAFSPDGSRVATASNDETARVWDARAGATLLVLKGHTNPVMSVAFSPDGSRIATGGHDRTARVWDARTGAALLVLKGHAGALMSVAFSPDGSRIATANLDGTARVWDARAGTSLLELKGHAKMVMSVAFSPDGSRIVTASQDRTARVWDARTGATSLELEGHTGGVMSVAFSPDGSRILTGSDDQSARAWDAHTGATSLELEGHTGGVMSVAFSPDGSRILTGSRDQTARVWDAVTGTPLLELKGHSGWVRGVAFSPDGSRIATASFDRTARVWDGRAGSPTLQLRGHRGRISTAEFSPDGSRIVTVSQDRTARVWDARTGKSLLILTGHSEGMLKASFTPEGSRIVTIGRDGTKVWDADTGQELKGEAPPRTIENAGISPDGRFIAHPDGNRVEVIPVQPDEEELASRRHHMQPNFRRYRESYDAARAAGDDFAARFYLNLFPPADRDRIRAEEIVKPLFARLGLREDVLAALRARPEADSQVQAACLELAGRHPESAQQCNELAWDLVRDPGRPEAAYRRGLRLAMAACRLVPGNGMALNTLGVAQYRCGLLAEAEATLSQSDSLNKGQQPSDLAFLALARYRLGQSEKALATLGRLREVMKNPAVASVRESQAFLSEAAVIEFDRSFPVDPFAR